MSTYDMPRIRLPFDGVARRAGHGLFAAGDKVNLELTETGIRCTSGVAKTPVFESGEAVEGIIGRARTPDGLLTVIFVPSPVEKGRLLGLALDEDGRIITVGEHIVEDDGRPDDEDSP
ncbi:MAG: hypothetical protein AAGC60_26995 [Acidobacteriota bacterium]